MKRILMEAKIQVIQVVLGSQTWYHPSRGRPLVLDLVRGKDRGAANRGRSLRGENAMVDVKGSGRENTSVRNSTMYFSCKLYVVTSFTPADPNVAPIRALIVILYVEMVGNGKSMHR